MLLRLDHVKRRGNHARHEFFVLLSLVNRLAIDRGVQRPIWSEAPLARLVDPLFFGETNEIRFSGAEVRQLVGRLVRRFAAHRSHSPTGSEIQRHPHAPSTQRSQPMLKVAPVLDIRPPLTQRSPLSAPATARAESVTSGHATTVDQAARTMETVSRIFVRWRYAGSPYSLMGAVIRRARLLGGTGPME